MTVHYPAFLDLRGRRCLVVGDTSLAAEKAAGLKASGALAELSPEFDPIRALGAFLIVADVDEGAARQIQEFGERERVFVNIVDKPEFCSFILPAIVRRGELSVAISTGGASPSLAGWLRRRLESVLGDEYGLLLSELRRTREEVKSRIPGYMDRKDFYYSLLDGGILDVAQRSGIPGVRLELSRKLEEFRS